MHILYSVSGRPILVTPTMTYEGGHDLRNCIKEVRKELNSHLKASFLQELHALLEREPEGLWEVLQRLYRELLCYCLQLRR